VQLNWQNLPGQSCLCRSPSAPRSGRRCGRGELRCRSTGRRRNRCCCSPPLRPGVFSPRRRWRRLGGSWTPRGARTTSACACTASWPSRESCSSCLPASWTWPIRPWPATRFLDGLIRPRRGLAAAPRRVATAWFAPRCRARRLLPARVAKPIFVIFFFSMIGPTVLTVVPVQAARHLSLSDSACQVMKVTHCKEKLLKIQFLQKLKVKVRGVATSPVVLRWLYDSPRTGCARRIKIYVSGANKQ